LRLVWYKARSRADEAWREQHGVDDTADTPFLWWQLDENGERILGHEEKPLCVGVNAHDLRATAATLMRDAGFSKEEAAARLGHADSGQLLERIYDVGDRRARMRRAIETLAPQGLRATLAEAPPRPSARPAAAGSTNLSTP
jgi:hypothetical protein